MVIPPSSGSGRVTAPPRLNPEEAFRQVDVANKGYVTESDLASAIVQLSPEGVSLSQTDAQAVAQKAITQLDTDRDGKVTLSEFEAAAPNRSPYDGPTSGRSPGPHGGGPPPGGGAGAPPAGHNAESTGSSQTYDPADTDQNGTVSETERLAYSNKRLTDAAPASAA